MALPTSRWGKLREGWWRYKHSGAAGDFAVLKADAFAGAIDPSVEARLARFAGLPPPIDLAALARLPADTFGGAYARFMKACDLKPFVVSDDLAGIAGRNVFAVRYATTHDMFHVLLDFDASWAGEMGVLAFAAAQRYHRQQRIGLALATVLYPLFSPLSIGRIIRARRRGIRLGRQAAFLLAEPLETFWEMPLALLRQQLKLDDPTSL